MNRSPDIDIALEIMFRETDDGRPMHRDLNGKLFAEMLLDTRNVRHQTNEQWAHAALDHLEECLAAGEAK